LAFFARPATLHMRHVGNATAAWRCDPLRRPNDGRGGCARLRAGLNHFIAENEIAQDAISASAQLRYFNLNYQSMTLPQVFLQIHHSLRALT
jgi:hypothetical protein